jgi:hypothetical protein
MYTPPLYPSNRAFYRISLLSYPIESEPPPPPSTSPRHPVKYVTFFQQRRKSPTLSTSSKTFFLFVPYIPVSLFFQQFCSCKKTILVCFLFSGPVFIPLLHSSQWTSTLLFQNRSDIHNSIYTYAHKYSRRYTFVYHPNPNSFLSLSALLAPNPTLFPLLRQETKLATISSPFLNPF